jgi:hypothetical protein
LTKFDLNNLFDKEVVFKINKALRSTKSNKELELKVIISKYMKQLPKDVSLSDFAKYLIETN